MAIQIKKINNLQEIDEDTWDSCSNPSSRKGKPLDPFTTYRFLRALEKSKSVGEGTGWYPQYLLALRNKEVVGVVPMYLKNNSQGEYIFDHNWAQAYQNAGGNYYPKLQISVPFTPATGRRFLLKDKNDIEVVLEIVKYIKGFSINNQISSAHITFCEMYEKKIPIQEYYKKMHQSKIIIAPLGYGEMAPRDIEAIQFGSILIKPDMSYISSEPFLYEDGRTYIACKYDWSDLEEKIDYVLSNFENLQHEMIEYTREIYEKKYNLTNLVLHYYDIIKNLGDVVEDTETFRMRPEE